LDEANEDTLVEVTTFVNSTRQAGSVPYVYREATLLIAIQRGTERIPTGFIVTGPNIASQSLLFKQLSARLKAEINGPIVVLRSGDASNLKSVLKQLIRDATNQSPSEDNEEVLPSEQGVSSLSLSP
jgi:origin recognition complex subunit 3